MSDTNIRKSTIKETNMQRSIVIPKELNEMIIQEAEIRGVSTNCVIRKILTDYYKRKSGER
ncbi:MAG: hypothetical protein NC131_01165 [Roseburia sp.]|nr:hypothetical protein [Roseburia sp.]